MNRQILADSSAFIALVDPTSPYHHRAQVTLRAIIENNCDILLTQEVLYDTLRMLNEIYYYPAVLGRFKELLHHPPKKKILEESPVTRYTQAINIFAFHPTTALPAHITQFLVMAWADVYQTKEIFAFNPVFETCGYTYPTLT